jgi:predicted amidophosphoribosyltransferase
LAESSQRSGCLATLWSLPVAFFHGFTGEFFSKCPDCRKHVDPQAKRCPHCGKWFNR